MKKAIVLGLFLVVSLSLVMLPVASAWQEGPGPGGWYINAQYVDDYVTGPLDIELNGDSLAGQVFFVGDQISISVYIHSYAISTAVGGNEAYTEWYLSVNGPSGSDSVWNSAIDTSLFFQAEVDTPNTLTIAYTATTPGLHTVYAASYAVAYQFDFNVHEEEIEAILTFEVEVVPTKASVLIGNDVPGLRIANAPGLQKIRPNANFAKGTAD